MSAETIEVPRPDRWDHPLDPGMSEEQVDYLLGQRPFVEMDVARFARSTSLADILRNDARIMKLSAGDVVFREGEYGGTAYLVLDGRIRVALSKLLPVGDESSQTSGPAKGMWPKLGQIWGHAKRWKAAVWGAGDRRKVARGKHQRRPEADAFPAIDYRGDGTKTRVFLQDIPGVLSDHSTSTVGPGELFGEMAAVTRSPREFTAFAEQDCVVLELRWQGLKLLRQDEAFRKLLDERYRSEVLRTHLRETTLFRFIPDEPMEQVVASAKLESFGNLEWYADYRKSESKDPRVRIETEPLIAEEGEYATGLWIIRGGFARLSQRQGAGYRTLAYLGKGQMFGLAELHHNYQRNHQPSEGPPLPYQESLRAIGYVDALCIPKSTVDQFVLPYVRQDDLPPPLLAPRHQFGQPVVDAPLVDDNRVDTGLLEFLVEERLVNGQKSMVIDTDRCTRCDDCVTACAKTHGGNAVFVREGPRYGPWMFPQACMHCADPVCMIGCPTGAIHRNYQTGVVQISETTCIGCKTCAESCPYSNIRMVTSEDGAGRAQVDEAGLPILQATKCDLCSSTNHGPACQTACPHDALVRLNLGDVDDVANWVHRRSA